ncbi:MAG: hypothetical protein MUF22_04490 [Chitinispirillaceae bacterium]|nr:hypothetical protein [Chitinispirillaceae bacterium]
MKKRLSYLAVMVLFSVTFSYAQQQAPDSATVPADTVQKAASPTPEAQSPVPTPDAVPVAPSAETAPAEAPATEAAKPPAPATAANKPTFELSAGAVTVNDEQWTRIAIGVDVPVWRFGVFFDLEAYLDPQGQFSDKGWEFGDKPFEALSRKIRYIRYGQETDRLFVKLGGLSNVTLGYGFIVDRFTNMLHYPDQKLAGMQLYVNDVTPLGLTVQFMGADALELDSKYEGGVGAARIAVRPLRSLNIPIVKNIAIGGMFARDNNVYAPARDWKPSANQNLVKLLDGRNVLTDTAVVGAFGEAGIDVDRIRQQNTTEENLRNSKSSFTIYGGDVGVPIIATSLLSLDVYAQAAIRGDSVHGWGIGAPGVALKVWRMSAGAEYRHIEGSLLPGFFGPYYLDERLERSPIISTKVDRLPDVSNSLNGVFGRLGFDVANVLLIDGGYQYMIGKDESSDQRFELTGNIGSMILQKIPKIKKLEAYLYKTRIGSAIVEYDSLGAPVSGADGKFTYDGFFEKTPYLYYGYRLGIELSPGATLIWDSRFGYERTANGSLVPNNSVTIQTAVTF